MTHLVITPWTLPPCILATSPYKLVLQKRVRDWQRRTIPFHTPPLILLRVVVLRQTMHTALDLGANGVTTSPEFAPSCQVLFGDLSQILSDQQGGAVLDLILVQHFRPCSKLKKKKPKPSFASDSFMMLLLLCNNIPKCIATA